MILDQRARLNQDVKYTSHIEMLDLDADESAISQSVNEKVNQVLEDEEDDYDMLDPDKEPEGIEGIDY